MHLPFNGLFEPSLQSVGNELRTPKLGMEKVCQSGLTLSTKNSKSKFWIQDLNYWMAERPVGLGEAVETRHKAFDGWLQFKCCKYRYLLVKQILKAKSSCTLALW